MMVLHVAILVESTIERAVHDAAAEPVDDVRDVAELPRRLAEELRIDVHRLLVFGVDVRVHPLRVRLLLLHRDQRRRS